MLYITVLQQKVSDILLPVLLSRYNIWVQFYHSTKKKKKSTYGRNLNLDLNQPSFISRRVQITAERFMAKRRNEVFGGKMIGTRTIIDTSGSWDVRKQQGVKKSRWQSLP